MPEICWKKASTDRPAEFTRSGAGNVRAHRRVLPLIKALFHQMDLVRDALEPRRSQEFAIELLSLLENEDRARQLQPDFDQQDYEYNVAWRTACTYELLSESTGQAEGFNSDGMHNCLSDGIQVCRPHRETRLHSLLSRFRPRRVPFLR